MPPSGSKLIDNAAAASSFALKIKDRVTTGKNTEASSSSGFLKLRIESNMSPIRIRFAFANANGADIRIRIVRIKISFDSQIFGSHFIRFANIRFAFYSIRNYSIRILFAFAFIRIYSHSIRIRTYSHLFAFYLHSHLFALIRTYSQINSHSHAHFIRVRIRIYSQINSHSHLFADLFVHSHSLFLYSARLEHAVRLQIYLFLQKQSCLILIPSIPSSEFLFSPLSPVIYPYHLTNHAPFPRNQKYGSTR